MSEVRNIFDYLVRCLSREDDNLLRYSKNYCFEKNPMYEKEHEETLNNINCLKNIINIVVDATMGNKELITYFGSYLIDSNNVNIQDLRHQDLSDAKFEGVYDCWEIYKSKEKVFLTFVPYNQRMITKKEYLLFDCYEGEELIGEFDRYEDVVKTANEHYLDTDGECSIVLYKLNHRYQKYELDNEEYDIYDEVVKSANEHYLDTDGECSIV